MAHNPHKRNKPTQQRGKTDPLIQFVLFPIFSKNFYFACTPRKKHIQSFVKFNFLKRYLTRVTVWAPEQPCLLSLLINLELNTVFHGYYHKILISHTRMAAHIPSTCIHTRAGSLKLLLMYPLLGTTLVQHMAWTKLFFPDYRSQQHCIWTWIQVQPTTNS